MNSTELIDLFHQSKEALGEKATDFNMFLEGYGAGITDNDVKKQIINKACNLLKEYNDKCELTEMINIKEFKKALEE